MVSTSLRTGLVTGEWADALGETMTTGAPRFDASLVRDDAERSEAHRLRYDVFVRELGGDGPMVDHDAALERDRYDAAARMLVLRDLERPLGQQIVGVYRLIGGEGTCPEHFYSAQEYDLSKLLMPGRKVLELGRSCLHPEYRGGSAMYHLWQALGRHVIEQDIELLFGVASFHGTDIATLAEPLAMLHHNHLAPERIRVRSLVHHPMDLVPWGQIDRLKAMQAIPALIKAYLRLGGCVGDGAYVDHAFNTVDVCLVIETSGMNPRQRAIYAAKEAE